MIHDLPENLLLDAGYFALRGGVDGIEECRERIAQAEAAAAAVADIKYALEFLLERARVVELRRAPR
jgi:hypothetical protein